MLDAGGRRISGRDAVARAALGARFELLDVEVVPGRIEDRGEWLLADQLTIMRWRGDSDPVDVSRQTLTIHVRDGLVDRLEVADGEVAQPGVREPPQCPERRRAL